MATYRIEAWDADNGRWDEYAVVGSASASENRFDTREQAEAMMRELADDWECPKGHLRVALDK